MHRRETWAAAVVLVLVAAVSVHLRLRGIAAASSLGDAIHPWWAALRGGWPRAHAAPYGWGLVVPYWVCQLKADSLWVATSRLLFWHAMMAPLAALCAWRMSGRSLLAGVVVGIAVAMDPGLIDTALSGAEGYLGAFWIGCMTLAVLYRDSQAAPILASLFFALAVMNHPLAAAAAPLLFCLRLADRRTWFGLAVGMAVLSPHVFRLLGESVTGGGSLGLPGEALPAYINQGGAAGWLVLTGPLVGMLHRRTRGMSVAVLSAWAGMVCLGMELGYLRDHHLRLLTVPALMGWSTAPLLGSVLCLLFVRVPQHPVFPADHVDRPGTVGLAHLLADQIAQEEPPLVVDGAWLSGGPAASPSAIAFDLYLRGWDRPALAPGGHVVVLVSAERSDMGQWPEGLEEINCGDRHCLLSGSADEVAAWSRSLCRARTEAGDAPPRLGGAWEALSVLHPGLSTPAASPWWACR